MESNYVSLGEIKKKYLFDLFFFYVGRFIKFYERVVQLVGEVYSQGIEIFFIVGRKFFFRFDYYIFLLCVLEVSFDLYLFFGGFSQYRELGDFGFSQVQLQVSGGRVDVDGDGYVVRVFVFFYQGFYFQVVVYRVDEVRQFEICLFFIFIFIGRVDFLVLWRV